MGRPVPPSGDERVSLLGPGPPKADDEGRLRLRAQSSLLFLPPSVGNASVSSCVVNLCSTILGAGVLGLPYAMKQCGVALGLVMFVVAAIMSGTGLHLLSECALKVENGSFDVMGDLTSPYFKFFASFAVAIKCFGVGTSYLIVLGDMMPSAGRALLCAADDPVCELPLPYSLLLDREACILLFSGLLISWLVTFKTMDALRVTSCLSLCAMLYISCTIMACAWIPSLDPCAEASAGCRGEVHVHIHEAPQELLRVLPLFIFAFTCHQNAFSLVNELKDPSPRRCNAFIWSAIGIACTYYCIVATSGYHTFGSRTPKNVMEGYPQSPLMALGRAGLSFTMAFNFPLQCHPCRNNLSVLLFGKQAYEVDNVRFYALTYAILAAAVFVAVTVRDLKLVLGLVGATGSTLISYILPGFFYATYFTTWHPRRVVACGMALLGCIFMPIMVGLCLF